MVSFVASLSAAFSQPIVTLKLAGDLVATDARGAQTLTPVQATALRPGAVVRYRISAANGGTEAARNLTPVARIPAGTAYLPGSAAASDAARVEFSLDGGRTWAMVPTIRVATPAGMVEKKADPSRYTSVRFVAVKPLAAKTTASYSYDVRVK